MNFVQITRHRAVEPSDFDYLFLIASIKPAISHPGEPCPAQAMWFVANEGRKEFPNSAPLSRIMAVPDDGRGCPSGEIQRIAQTEVNTRQEAHTAAWRAKLEEETPN